MKFTLPRGLRLAWPFVFACATVLPADAFVRSAGAAGATISLYTDATGNTCSFSGNASGLITVYVVVRPDEHGVSAVQFAAPIPVCLGATFVEDVVPPGALAIGESQTGITVALQTCSFTPVNVLQITYLRSGDTTPCCEFPIVRAPALGDLIATSCGLQEFPVTPIASHFNADATCACIGNSPPHAPIEPMPYDNQTALSVQTSFSWSATDVDGNLAEYDLYLGTIPSPPLVAAELTDPAYTPAVPLAPLAMHYWRVVARDAMGLESSSATWTFTTRDVNSPPYEPQYVSPANGARNVLLDAPLRWVGGDIDDDPVTYDVYFGTSSPPPLAQAGVTGWNYFPGSMDFGTTYYWRVVARDPDHETSSALWSFETRPLNYPPNLPTVLAPRDGLQGVSVTVALSWSATDNDPDTLVSDVYFGTSPTPPLVATDLDTTTYAPPGLAFSTQYYWRIVVRDHHGAETMGPTWYFTTRPENYPPAVPSSPTPPNGALNRSESSTLSWQCSDLDGHAITYDVYFGTVSPPPLVAPDVATKSYAPGLLAFGTTYWWKIVARDVVGAETAGPTWTFQTRVNSPPNVPSNPSPANGAVNRPLNTTLAWGCTDPNGHALTFDVYFGTASPPPLVATNVAAKSYAPGPLEFSTTYRWQIIARDVFGLERVGPVWTFTTKANAAPTTPSNPSPPNHGVVVQTPLLTWTSTDADGHPLTFDVYFGTTSPPPLVASGLTIRQYEPGTLPFAQYFWRVVASDGLLSSSGATWDFRVAQMGDANLDGAVTVEDASCAIGSYTYSGPCAMGGFIADVDCNSMVTPRDARCIHMHVVDSSCAFCEGGALAAPADVNTPVVSVSATWEWNDTLYVRLSVSGVPSLEAFGFVVQSYADQMRAVRRGATNDFVEFRNSPYPWFGVVGGYSLSGVDAESPVAFVDLRFYARYWYDRYAYISDFADDLAGASPLSLYLGGGGIAVLITRFNAAAVDGGVEVNWELRSDEAMESYTLYRREEGESAPNVIVQGPAASRSYLDTSVESGKTYHYELLIRAAAGGEFRSQIATVSTRSLTLSLGQNRPNPFNPQTVIPYEIPHAANRERVRLWILDISGRVVATLVDEDQGGGSYQVTWQGRDDRGETVSSGVYFYVLDVGGERRTKKLVLLK